MTTSYEVSIEIDEKSDAYAIRRLTEQIYDTVREELRGTDRSDQETLQQFKEIRNAARETTSGTLTIRYEQSGDSFEE